MLDGPTSQKDVIMSEEEDALTSFLNKVDKVDELVKELRTSDVATSKAAIEKADTYLQSLGQKGFDKTMVNASSKDDDMHPEDSHLSHERLMVSPTDGFCKALEEDAKERAERRKEKEKIGKEFTKSGNTAFKQGDFEAAVISYSEGIKQMPWDITLYTNRGQAYYQKSSYQLALDDFNTALRIQPDHFKALIHKGKTLAIIGKYDEACATYDEAKKVTPSEHKLIQGYIDELEAKKNTQSS
ncbi:tetratricopeptide repeat protein 12-like [Dysidea avara]|uniref:tetratricopeptide repeat protein 12-like n=1 Tax=Dysidea avara TaxID=196820 RepID=UPI0033191BEE